MASHPELAPDRFHAEVTSAPQQPDAITGVWHDVGLATIEVIERFLPIEDLRRGAPEA